MRITPALRKAINAAVRPRVGQNPLSEVGLRGDGHAPNALNWAEEDDLWDLRRLADLKEIDDCAAHPGCHELDLYVTTGTRSSRELETNVCVLIRDGQVVGATEHMPQVPELKKRLGFPAGRW